MQDQPPQGIEVEMVEAETVRQIRALAALGWGSWRIAGELGVARRTVQRYVRGATAEIQLRPIARSLTVEAACDRDRLRRSSRRFTTAWCWLAVDREVDCTRARTFRPPGVTVCSLPPRARSLHR